MDLQSLLTYALGKGGLTLPLSIPIFSPCYIKLAEPQRGIKLLLNGCPNQNHPGTFGQSTHLAISGDGSEETPGNYS